MDNKQLLNLVQLLIALKEKLKCPICLDVIQNVTELSCGHRYCEECYSQHKSNEKQVSCPMCKNVVTRRSSFYKDMYADSLGKFVYKTCQSISSLYNCEVEILQKKLNGEVLSKRSVLEDVTENGPNVALPSTFKGKKTAISKASKENCSDAFDHLMNSAKDSYTFNKDGVKRVYTNKKIVEKGSKPKPIILQFDNYENKSAVLQWLNDTRNKFDRLTQTQNSCNDDFQASIDLTSISQVKEKRLGNCISRKRTKSLDVDIKKVIPSEKRYSDGGISQIIENYDIEEINTEEENVVKKAEEKVLLDLIEDKFLDKLESEMQETAGLKKRSEKTLQEPRPTTSSGWERVSKIKKTIKQSKKVPRQLNVTLQSTQNTKIEKETKKLDHTPIIEIIEFDADSDPPDRLENSENKNDKTENNSKSYDLNKLEDYIEKNMQILDKNTSTESRLSPYSEKNTHNCKVSPEKKKTLIVEIDDEETQCPPNIIVNNENIDTVDVEMVHVPYDKNKTNGDILTQESDDEKCLTMKKACDSPSEILNAMENSLKMCMANSIFLNSNVTKHLKAIKCNVMQLKLLHDFSNMSKDSKCDVFIQTVIETIDIKVQTELKCNTIATQTEVDTEAKEEWCAKCKSNSTTNDASGVKTSLELKDDSKVEPQNKLNPSQHSQIFTSTFDNINFETQDLINHRGVIVRSTQKHVENNNREPKIFPGKDLPSIKTDQQKSQAMPGSLLVCSLDATNESNVNRKSMYDANTSKRFKRIRMPESDSDSDEENKPKRLCNRFIRDDLTIEFQTNPGAAQNDYPQSNESINYDEYLAQVLKKYEDNDFNKTATETKQEDLPPKKTVIKQIITKCENMIDQASKNIQHIRDLAEISSSSKESFKTASAQNDINEDFLAEDNIFMNEANLIKLENDIRDYEKAKDTESSDIITQTENVEALPRKRRKIEDQNIDPESAKLLDIAFKESNHIVGGDISENGEKSEEKGELGEAGGNKKVNIIANILLTSPSKVKPEEEDLFSDDDIVETTPQKKRQCNSFVDRSLLSPNGELEHTPIENPLPDVLSEADPFDFDIVALPPPPDFQDEDFNNEETLVDNDATVINRNKLSLTPDQLSQFFVKQEDIKDSNYSQILSPRILPYNREIKESDAVVRTPEKVGTRFERNISHSTPVTQGRELKETLGFSPIRFEENEQKYSNTMTKESTVQSKSKQNSGIVDMALATKYTPLKCVSKNTPAKQNILTSVPKQKSMWNYIRPSQVDSFDEENVPPTSESKPVVSCTRLSKDQVRCISQLMNNKLAIYSNVFDMNVTHMIVVVDSMNRLKEYTMKFVSAVASGIWVLRFEWVEECLKKRCIVPEGPYEVLDISGAPGPRTSRLTRQTNPLWRGYKFYCVNQFVCIAKAEIEHVIKLLGGKVLSNLDGLLEKDGNIGLIIAEGMSTQDFVQYESWLKEYKTVTVDIEWFSKCVGQYKLLSVRPYIWCSDDSLYGLNYPDYLLEAVPLSYTDTY